MIKWRSIRVVGGLLILSLLLIVTAVASNGPQPAFETAIEGQILDVQMGVWGKLVYVVTQNPNRLYAVSPAGGRIVQQCDLPYTPWRVAVINDNYKAFVTAPTGGPARRGAILVVDLTNCGIKELTYDTPPAPADVNVDQFGQNPLGIALTRTNSAYPLQAVVANIGPGRDIVVGRLVAVYGAAQVDAKADSVIGGASGISKIPVEVAVCELPTGPMAYIVHRTRPGLLSILDLSTGDVEAVEVGNRPTDIAVDLSCTTAFIVNGGDATLQVVDLVRGRVSAPIDLSGGLPIQDSTLRASFDEANGKLYVFNPNFNEIIVYDVASGGIKRVRTGVTSRIGGITTVPGLGGALYIVVGVNNPDLGNRLQWFAGADFID